jgi:hypothetical protein
LRNAETKAGMGFLQRKLKVLTARKERGKDQKKNLENRRGWLSGFVLSPARREKSKIMGTFINCGALEVTCHH